jgi:hypothetical protein
MDAQVGRGNEGDPRAAAGLVVELGALRVRLALGGEGRALGPRDGQLRALEEEELDVRVDADGDPLREVDVEAQDRADVEAVDADVAGRVAGGDRGGARVERSDEVVAAADAEVAVDVADADVEGALSVELPQVARVGEARPDRRPSRAEGPPGLSQDERCVTPRGLH